MTPDPRIEAHGRALGTALWLLDCMLIAFFVWWVMKDT